MIKQTTYNPYTPNQILVPTGGGDNRPSTIDETVEKILVLTTQCAFVTVEPVFLARLKLSLHETVSKHPATSWQNLVNCMIEACMTGLLPDGREAAIIPYRGVLKFIVMRLGWIKIIHHYFALKGQTVDIKTGVIRQGQVADESVHTGVTFKNDPIPFDELSSRPIVGAYAQVYNMQTGKFHTQVINMDIINACQNSSPSKGSFAWKDFYQYMCEKCALHRLASFLNILDLRFTLLFYNDMVPFTNGHAFNINTALEKMRLCTNKEDLFKAYSESQFYANGDRNAVNTLTQTYTNLIQKI